MTVAAVALLVALTVLSTVTVVLDLLAAKARRTLAALQRRT